MEKGAARREENARMRGAVEKGGLKGGRWKEGERLTLERHFCENLLKRKRPKKRGEEKEGGDDGVETTCRI